MKLSIIMPTFNERRTIREIVRRVLAVDLGDAGKELVIVDDASTDGIRIVHHERNLGKGAAVARGLREATGDIVLVQDADLE